MTMQVEKEKRSEHSIGLINGYIAYIIWGAVILYWPYLAPAKPLDQSSGQFKEELEAMLKIARLR
jgi:hypothetical protein